MTITYELYPPHNGMYPGVIPLEHVGTLSGESYKYVSSKGGTRRKKRVPRKSRKSKKTRSRKITPLK
jgi:hypothetical protein